jgi:glycosyltransferase involved in cell wall biosynthesis
MMVSRPAVLCIPTLNEAESIGSLLDEVPRDLIQVIIVADGGSTDSTRSVAENRGARIVDAGRGYGRACLKAAEAAPQNAILVFMDGDGADDPRAIASLVGPLVEGRYDFVIGSRVRGTREKGSMGWHQVAAGYAFGLAVKSLYGTHYTDMCAFRAISRETLLALGMRELTYGWNLEMQMRAARAGLRILEIPVANRLRSGGKSKVAGSVRGTLRAGTRIVATFVRVARERVAKQVTVSP